MNKIVELSSKELDSISGGIDIILLTFTVCAAGRFLSDYLNHSCDTWKENGWSSKYMCYGVNASLEGIVHGGLHILLAHPHNHHHEE